MKLLIFLIFVIITKINIYAQEEIPKHRIDIEMQKCLEDENNFTTTGMVECTGKAYDDWDKELNIVYKKLMELLSDKERATLKKAQKEWIKFRDLEYNNIDDIYDKLQGTMYTPMRLNEKMQIVKTRVLQLDGYIQILLPEVY